MGIEGRRNLEEKSRNIFEHGIKLQYVKDFLLFGLNYFILGLMIAIPVFIYPPLVLLSFTMMFFGRISSDMRTNGKYENLASVNSDELGKFLSELGEDEFEMKKSVRESGAVIHRIAEPNMYILPSHTEPEMATAESKAVLSHEYSHVKNNHKIKSILYDTVSVSMNAFVLGLLSTAWIIPVFIFNSFILLPLIKNYISHQFEFRSDSYAAEKVGVRAVQNRLRRNSHLQEGSNFTYATTHPSVQIRMDRINKGREKELATD